MNMKAWLPKATLVKAPKTMKGVLVKAPKMAGAKGYLHTKGPMAIWAGKKGPGQKWAQKKGL
jgi:hypothetical protein